MKHILLIASLLMAAASEAAIFQVDLTVIDNVDETPGDGICKIPVSDFCTLRAAIMETNALPGNDIIVLPGNTTIQLSIDGANENSAATGDLDITDSVAIGTFIESIEDYPTVTGANIDDRVFDVRFDTGLVTFVNFKIVNGDASSNLQNGGAIQVGPFNDVEVISVWFEDNIANTGGAVYVSPLSEFSAINSVFRGNAAVVNGAALATLGDSTLSQMSVFENLNFNGALTAEAIYVGYTPKIGKASLILNNSTVFNNSNAGIFAEGGDVFVRNSSLVENNNYGIVMHDGVVGNTVSLRNTILYNHTFQNCISQAGVTESANNYNISNDVHNCADNDASTNLLVNPELGPMQIDNDNWHRYFRPKFASPVVDSAHPSTPGLPIACLADDQLELDRINDGGDRCDRGAIEVSSDIIYYDEFETL